MTTINVTVKSIDGKEHLGILPRTYSLANVKTMLCVKLGDSQVVDKYSFMCKGKQLLLNDPKKFEDQKTLIDDECEISAAKNLLGGACPPLHDLINKTNNELSSAADAIPKQAFMCAICRCNMLCIRFPCNFCSYDNALCKECFVKYYSTTCDFSYRCLSPSCHKAIHHKRLFTMPTYIKLLSQLKDMREKQQNIDCQICRCGELQINKQLFSKQFCEKCRRWFCFFCNKTWNDGKMRNQLYTCGNNCAYENKITFEPVLLAGSTSQMIPNRRACPICFQLGFYGGKCPNHTCDRCGTEFCFFCLFKTEVCKNTCSKSTPFKTVTYSIFPKTTDI